MAEPGQSPTAPLPRVLAFAVLALVAGAVVMHGARPLLDLDLWWHMKLGELLLAGEPDTSVEVFSHTQAGNPWPWKDAGAAILFHGLWQLGGAPVIIGFKVLLFGALAWLLWRWIHHERKVPTSLAVLILAAVLDAVAFRFTERAASISLVILVLALLLVERDRRGLRGLWWVVPLTILNANLHRGVLLVPVVLWAYAVTTVVEVRLGRDRNWRRAALVALGSSLGCLVTPYGITIITTTIALTGQHSPLITEWAPVSRELIAILTPASFITIGATVLGTALGQWKLRPWSPWDLMLAAMALTLGSSSMRHLPVLALLGAGPAASGLAAASKAWTGRLRGLIAVSSAGVLLASTLARPVELPGSALTPAHYPERGLAFINALPEELHPQGALFNEFGLGGFIIFHLWPRHRVYIDGRTDLVYPASFVEHYSRVLHEHGSFAKEVQERELEWVFVDNVPMDKSRLHFDLDPAWTLVHASRRALIYVRAQGPNAALAERHGYRWLAAHDLVGSLQRAAARGQGDAAFAELRRMVDEDPDNIHALMALAAIAPPDALQ
ncbi:MAG: hypothetical protein AAF799_37860 [Myxococcota bacterium]